MRCSTIPFCALAAACALGQDAPKADRTAESRLKQVVEAMGKLKSLQAEISIVSRDQKSMPYYPVGRIGLWWQSGAGFRVEQTGTWGDGQVFVSDGRTLLVDGLYMVLGVTLREAKPTIYECDSALAMRGGASTPLYYFLNGERGLAELVAKEGEIVACPGERDEEGIRFKTTKLGTMRVFFRPKDKDLKIVRIDFDNLDYRNELAVQLAEWGYEKPVDPLDVHTVRYVTVNQRFAKAILCAEPPPHLIVRDERPKKPGA